MRSRSRLPTAGEFLGAQVGAVHHGDLRCQGLKCAKSYGCEKQLSRIDVYRYEIYIYIYTHTGIYTVGIFICINRDDNPVGDFNPDDDIQSFLRRCFQGSLEVKLFEVANTEKTKNSIIRPYS